MIDAALAIVQYFILQFSYGLTQNT